jgi:glucosamine-6-phosphate deaminase
MERKIMAEQQTAVRRFQVEKLKVEIYADKDSAGAAAAQAAAAEIKRLGSAQETLGVIFSTGASQLAMLRALTAIPDLPWGKVVGFHMDEYIGLSPDHPASFRRYLRENLTSKVKMKQFYEVNGTASDPQQECREYGERLRAADPQLCVLGVGENGHLAFNDPGVADFHDPLDVKIVEMDQMCRQQQVAEGWFKGGLPEVPKEAITLTIPALLRVPKLIVSVPGPRKATIVRRTLTEPIATACPATILRTHPDVTMYLDKDSAAEIDDLGKTAARK